MLVQSEAIIRYKQLLVLNTNPHVESVNFLSPNFEALINICIKSLLAVFLTMILRGLLRTCHPGHDK